MNRRKLGYYLLFVVLLIGIFVVVHSLTGYDVLGAAARLVWNLLALAVNTVTRLFGEFASVIARAAGLRRLSRLATTMASVGLGYAGAVILSDRDVRRAQGWRDKDSPEPGEPNRAVRGASIASRKLRLSAA